MPRVYSLRYDNIPGGAIRIDRSTKWGNPYAIGHDGTREEVLAKHAEYARLHPQLIAAAQKELVGKDLL